MPSNSEDSEPLTPSPLPVHIKIIDYLHIPGPHQHSAALPTPCSICHPNASSNTRTYTPTISKHPRRSKSFFFQFFFFLRRIGIRRSRIQVSGTFSLTSDPSSHTSLQPTPSAPCRDLRRPRTPLSLLTPLFSNSLHTTRLGLRTSDPANPFLCYHRPLPHPDIAPCLRRVHRPTPTSSLAFNTSIHPSPTPSWLTGTSTFKRLKQV